MIHAPRAVSLPPTRAWALALWAATLLLLMPAAHAQQRQVQTAAGPVQVEPVASGLSHPWGLAFLPDGTMLVTERPGRLRIVSPDGSLSPPVSGVPQVAARGQGGLLDVALDPGFADNGVIYLSFSEPGNGGSSTAVARGRLDGGALHDVEVIFSQQPKLGTTQHFGSRLVFATDGTLFLTLGDRGRPEMAQDTSNHVGTVIRINSDGSVPQDNPFVGRSGALPEIWSYGHRNQQGAALHPQTGILWTNEHGPRGGDELNIPQAGANHGWPLVSWGRQYAGASIPDPPTRPDLVQALHHWTPSIGTSGMDFYTGDLFPTWTGSVLVGGLVSQGLARLTLDGDQITDEERIDLGARVRQVLMGPDGAIYVLTDHDPGEILRLSPAG